MMKYTFSALLRPSVAMVAKSP